MGTQGNGGHVNVFHRGEIAQRSALCAWASLTSFLTLLMVVLALWTSAARAQTTQYVYDANGRVVAVTQTNGTTAQYTYDTLGHLAQTTTVASGQLAIFAFIPTHGEAGTQVTIEGQGFSASPASDSVSFNGTPATVVSASATQIVTTVPSGATTGPISVTVSGNTAVSTTPFVIDDTGLPPNINQVSPTIVSAGNTVTVTGSHLDPVPGDTTVQMGNSDIGVLSSISDTQLQFTVPSDASSSYVKVETPYGSANSGAPIIVLPNSISTSNVTSSANTTLNGAAINLNVGGSGQIAALSFTGNIGQLISLQFSAFTPSSNAVTYTIYAPGNVVMQQGSVSTSLPSLHLPALPVSGSYLVIFQSSQATQLTVNASTDSVLQPNTSLALTTNASGQSQRLVFQVAANNNLELALVGLSGTGAATATVYNASGVNVGSISPCNANPPPVCRLALWNMAPGTYTIMVTPNSSTNLNFNVLLQPDIEGPQLGAGTPAAINLATGQVERFTFTANAGDSIALNVSNVSIATGETFAIQIYQPGSTITTSNYYTTCSGDCTLNLTNLPASGAYTVVAYTRWGSAATAQLEMVDLSTGTLTSGGAAQDYATQVVGQNIYLSFTANQGDNLELTLAGLSGTAAATVNVYSASGENIGSVGNCSANPPATCRLPLWNMVAGTYSVIITPNSSAATMNFNVLLQPDVQGPLLATGASTAVNLATGQVERFTFTANAGNSFALNVSNVSATTGDTFAIQVYQPGSITSTNYYATCSGNCTLNLPNLPASGTYTVAAYTQYGAAATAQLEIVPASAGTLTSGGAAQGYATQFNGQNIYLSFTANQGDNLELALIGQSGTATGTATVYSANGTSLGSLTDCNANAPPVCRLSLWNLAAGTYTVIVTPNSSSGMLNFNVLLQPDAQGPQLSAGTVSNINLATGQVERSTFTANAGSAVTLIVSNVSVTSGETFAIEVYQPGNITTSNYYTTCSGNCSLNLTNLPTTGTYTVVAYTHWGSAATAQIEMIPAVLGTLSEGSTGQNYTTQYASQDIYLTFTANQGDNLELALVGLSGTITGTATVYSANGTYMGSLTDCNANPPPVCRIGLWNLAAGTYSVLVTPNTASGTLNFNVLLQPDIQGPGITTSGPQTIDFGIGQVERLTVTVNAGDTIALNVTNVNAPNDTFYINLYQPGSITTSNYEQYCEGNCSISVQSAPATGTYTVVAYTHWGAAATAQLNLTSQ